jgi:hypothetical protein
VTTPPSPVAPSPHTWPAIKQPVVPGALGSPQVPTATPDCLVQIPVQHSASVAQRSLICRQNDGCPEHRPPEQYLEQQSPCPAQVLPAVLHPEFSGWHRPLVQVPPQHCAPLVHAWLSETHTLAPQRPPSQTSVQHSVGAAQLSPAALQLPAGVVQVFRFGSQFAEQQSACEAQVVPAGLQSVLTSMLASPPPPAPPPAPPGVPSSESPQPGKSAPKPINRLTITALVRPSARTTTEPLARDSAFMSLAG